MATEIIISLIFGVSSIVTSIFFGLIPNLRKERITSLENRIKQRNQDLDFFFAEEILLLEQLCQATGENIHSKKIAIRQSIERQKGRTIMSHPSKVKAELR